MVRSTRRSRLLAAGWAIVALPLLGAVVVMAARVGDTARFVTWPVVGFTALAAGVALVGFRAGRPRRWEVVAGILPGLVLSYVLPAAPLALMAVVLTGLGCLAVAQGGVAAGTAATTGTLMVLAVVLQGPAVSCHPSGVSGSSGPWWIGAGGSSSGSSTVERNGSSHGTTQVGSHTYVYSCVDGRLITFGRTD